MTETPASPDPTPGGPSLSQELTDLSGDLRNWLEVNQGLAAGPSEGVLPSTLLPPEHETAPPGVTEEDAAGQPTAVEQPPTAPTTTAPTPPSRLDLAEIREQLGDCTRCGLHQGRTELVFGTGNKNADIVFVAAAPGAEDDLSGAPFAGPEGDLLDRIINNVLRLERADVYLCTVVKCRPAGDRDPQPDEVETCAPVLWKQLSAIRPSVVVALGPFATQVLLGSQEPLENLRGRGHKLRGGTLVPTYHPTYLLSHPAEKRAVFDDMKLVRQVFEERTGRSLPPMTDTRGAKS